MKFGKSIYILCTIRNIVSFKLLFVFTWHVTIQLLSYAISRRVSHTGQEMRTLLEHLISSSLPDLGWSSSLLCPRLILSRYLWYWSCCLSHVFSCCISGCKRGKYLCGIQCSKTFISFKPIMCIFLLFIRPVTSKIVTVPFYNSRKASLLELTFCSITTLLLSMIYLFRL